MTSFAYFLGGGAKEGTSVILNCWVVHLIVDCHSSELALVDKDSMRNSLFVVLFGRQQKIGIEGYVFTMKFHHWPSQSGLVRLHILYKMTHEAIGINFNFLLVHSQSACHLLLLCVWKEGKLERGNSLYRSFGSWADWMCVCVCVCVCVCCFTLTVARGIV